MKQQLKHVKHVLMLLFSSKMYSYLSERAGAVYLPIINAGVLTTHCQFRVQTCSIKQQNNMNNNIVIMNEMDSI